MHQAFVELLAPLGSWGRLIEVLHPVPLSLVVALLLFLIVRRTRLRAYWRRILLVLLALYAVDAAFALRRVAYAWSSPAAPVIARTIPLPARPVLVNIECDRACHERLASGVFEEVHLVRGTGSDAAGKPEYDAHPSGLGGSRPVHARARAKRLAWERPIRSLLPAL